MIKRATFQVHFMNPDQASVHRRKKCKVVLTQDEYPFKVLTLVSDIRTSEEAWEICDALNAVYSGRCG